jgi:predicted transposase YbfD/YdcC
MPYSIASSLTLPSVTSAHRERLLSEKPLLSLYELFTTIPDPRSGHGRRYPLAYLLTCLIAALLCNCNSTVAVSQWCRDQQDQLKRFFPFHQWLCPSDSLYRKLLARLPAEQIEWALADWVRSTLCADADDPLALDGKTVRGAASATQPAPHLLSFCTHHSQEVLLQVHVSEKTNEIPVAQALLPCVPVAGRVCTADALHTHREFLQRVQALGGACVLTVKKNQPTLYKDLALYFADPHACCVQASTRDDQRGRCEIRHIRVSTEMNTYLAAWPEIAQVAELTRTVTVRRTGKTTQEVVYLFTDLPPAQASPERLLALVRGHWQIENGLHYVRDVSFGEDRSRLRSGSAPQILAALRNLALTLLHRSGLFAIAVARRSFASHPSQALALLLPKEVGQQSFTSPVFAVLAA